MGALGPWHSVIVAVVVVLLFGSKRLPDAARSLGSRCESSSPKCENFIETTPRSQFPYRRRVQTYGCRTWRKRRERVGLHQGADAQRR